MWIMLISLIIGLIISFLLKKVMGKYIGDGVILFIIVFSMIAGPMIAFIYGYDFDKAITTSEKAQNSYERREKINETKYEEKFKYEILGHKFFTEAIDEWGDKVIPDGNCFLVIKISVTNKTKEQRMIPSFKLIDENNIEYGVTFKANLKDEIGILYDLNPDVGISGLIVFDLPTQHRRYRLKVSNHITSGQYEYLNIN